MSILPLVLADSVGGAAPKPAHELRGANVMKHVQLLHDAVNGPLLRWIKCVRNAAKLGCTPRYVHSACCLQFGVVASCPGLPPLTEQNL